MNTEHRSTAGKTTALTETVPTNTALMKGDELSDVSIVMATYNGARHIRTQLESILAQTWLPAEIVICDDGSTDETLEIARDVAAQTAVPIRIHVNESRLGYADNFLHCAALSTSRYISFSDQDDIWYPTKLERSMRAIARHGAVFCTHQVVQVTEAAERIRLDPQEISRDAVIRPGLADPFGVYFGFTMVFDRRLLDLLPAAERGMDNFDCTQTLSHDRWLYFLATTFGTSVALAEPLADYRQHESQTFGVTRYSLVQRFMKKVDEGPQKLAALAEIAGERRRLIARSRPANCGIAEFSTWRAAETRWARVERYCLARHDLYLANRFTERVGLLTMNAVRGAYRSTTRGGLGEKRFLEDVTLGLFGRVASRW